VAAVTLILVLLWLAGDLLPEPLNLGELPRSSVVVLIAGLGCAFILYVVEKESSLRRLTNALIEERVHSDALTARLAETASIAEVAKALNDTLETKDVFGMILSSVLELSGGREASIMLVDEDRTTLEVVSYQGPREADVLRRKVAMGEGVAGRVAQERRPMLLQADDPLVQRASSAPAGVIRSSMCVPLTRRGEVIGVLSVNETGDERTFTEHDLSILEVFAEHAAIAIGNASQFEQEREHVQRLEELDRLKSDFIATVSHELKTPLTAIIGAAKTVTRSGEMDPDQRAMFLEMIQRQGTGLLRLVEDILTTARIESGARGRREPVDLRDVAELVLADMRHTRHGRDRTITFETLPERPEAWGDLTAIQQILSNLLENACKYSPPDTPVSLRIIESSAGTTIEVADRGRGIAAEEVDSIFDRFRQVDSSATRNVGGFGLGLYIVKSLVEQHQGTIEVESEAGRGSLFRVRLPARAGDADDRLSAPVSVEEGTGA
jgi:signal transduction histidine kinase